MINQIIIKLNKSNKSNINKDKINCICWFILENLIYPNIKKQTNWLYH
jgi:hypothetical protein